MSTTSRRPPSTAAPRRQTPPDGSFSDIRQPRPSERAVWPWVLGAIFSLLAVVQVWNMRVSPWWRDDEGTYVAQAWAVVNEGELAHYTYWYDHPPLGWLMVAGWAWLTDGFDRVSGVGLGREVAALAAIASMPLLYLAARRMGIGRGFAVGAVALFVLSPLALENHRVLWIDNLATPLFLAALVLALGRTRPVLRLLGAGALLGAACLTKETFLLLAPAVAVAAWTTLPAGRRVWPIVAMAAGAVLTLATYPLYALSRGELLDGGGVSLEQGIRFQLLERAGSGSVLDPGSDAYETLRVWLEIDPWILLLGLASLPIALARPRLRPAGVGLAVLLVALVVRTGYLPVPYVVAMIPVATLCVAGAAQELTARAGASPWRATIGPLRMTASRLLLAGAVLVAVLALPAWLEHDRRLLTEDQSRPARDAVDWLDANAPRDAAILVDDTIWVDLVERGFDRDRVIWFYKLDLDPGVAARFPGGHRDIDYVVSSAPVRSSSGGLTEVRTALEQSESVARFGNHDVRRVTAGGP